MDPSDSLLVRTEKLKNFVRKERLQLIERKIRSQASNMDDDPTTLYEEMGRMFNARSIAQPKNPLPPKLDIKFARESLIRQLPEEGLSADEAIRHVKGQIALGFNSANDSSTYFGFVTGGITPAARIADHLVTEYDQNVQVHLPEETISTEVEDRALSMLCELFDLKPEHWGHRTFTTGATASNILGLACARDYVLRKAASIRDGVDLDKINVGEYGLASSMQSAGIDRIQMLATVPHSSISKAASVVGLGRASVTLVGLEEAPHKFDMRKLETLIKTPKVASIVVISASEVNTGLFATNGLEKVLDLRRLCDKYGAWIHIDAGRFINLTSIVSSSSPLCELNCSNLQTL